MYIILQVGHSKDGVLKRIIQTDMVLDGNMVQIHGVMTYHI